MTLQVIKTLLIRPFSAALEAVSFLSQCMWLALGQIRANKSRSVLTTLGIVVGVASVTAVIASLTGLKANILEKFETAVGSRNIFIFPERPEEGRLEHAPWETIRLEPEDFENLLKHCPSVERFTRICGNRDSAGYRDKVLEDVAVNGIDPTWHQIQGRSVFIGRPFSAVDSENARHVCLVTPDLRDKLHLDRDCTEQSILIGRRSFQVVGVVEGAPEFMRHGGSRELEVFIPFSTAWKFNWPWMWVMASSKSGEVAKEARAQLRFFLRRAKNLEPEDPDTFRLEVMEKHLREIKNLALIMTAVAGGIVGISLLVGGIGIMNIMLVSVSERTREIGLRKAVGARPSAILLQFLVEAVILCLLGGFLGLCVGQLLTKAIASIPNAQLEMAYIPLWAVGVAFGFSALVGVFFGMFPAIKAARLDPIEALRHE